MPLALLINL